MYGRPLFEACPSHGKAYRTVEFMAYALAGAARSGCGDACFHAVAPKLTDASDPTMYARVSDETRALDELADSLSEADSGGRLSWQAKVLLCRTGSLHREFVSEPAWGVVNRAFRPHA